MIDAEERESIAQETNIGPLLFIEHEGNSYLATRPKGEWARELMAKGKAVKHTYQTTDIMKLCLPGTVDLSVFKINFFRALLNLLTLGVWE